METTATKRATKPAAPKAVKANRNLVNCADCGVDYDAGAPHTMFCQARTCDDCGRTFSYKIQPSIVDGRRLCDECAEGY